MIMQKNIQVLHYDNMPIQYTAFFTAVKMIIFEKKLSHISYFCSEYRSWVQVRTASVRRFTVLTCIHHLCFRANIRKNMYHYKPQFYYIKVGCEGV